MNTTQFNYSPAFIHILYSILFLQVVLIITLLYETYLFSQYVNNINTIYMTQFEMLSREHLNHVHMNSKDIMDLSFKSNLNTVLFMLTAGAITCTVLFFKIFAN